MPSPIPNNNHPKGAFTMDRCKHIDRLGQPVTVDAVVAFTWRQGTGVRVGRVVKLTAKRVRIAYIAESTHQGETQRWASNHITAAENVIVLNSVEQQLTVLALRGLLP